MRSLRRLTSWQSLPPSPCFRCSRRRRFAGADPIDDQRSKVEQHADKLEDLEEESASLAEEYDMAIDELRQLEEDVVAAEEAVADKQAEVAELRAQPQRRRHAGVPRVPAATAWAIFSESEQFNEELQRTS